MEEIRSGTKSINLASPSTLSLEANSIFKRIMWWSLMWLSISVLFRNKSTPWIKCSMTFILRFLKLTIDWVRLRSFAHPLSPHMVISRKLTLLRRHSLILKTSIPSWSKSTSTRQWKIRNSKQTSISKKKLLTNTWRNPMNLRICNNWLMNWESKGNKMRPR